MGYRSNVTIALYTNNKEQVPMAALKLWFDENYPVEMALKEWDAEITYGSDYVLVEYQDVKWHGSYVHPHHVRTCLDRFIEAFRGDGDMLDTGGNSEIAKVIAAWAGVPVAWEYARVGEEASDVELLMSDDHESRLWVRREITFD